MKETTFWLFLTLCFTLLVPATTQTQIELGKSYKVTLESQIPQQYKLIIKETIPNSSQLFISAYSTLADPTQEPLIKITYNNEEQKCEMEIQELNDVCLLTGDKLKIQSEINIELECLENCEVNLYAYVSDLEQLNLGEKKVIKAGKQPIEKVIRINIHKGLYDDVLVLATDQTSSLDMYIDYGSNAGIPVKQNRKKVKELSWSATKGLRIKAGALNGVDNTIYVLLSIQAYGIVQFWAQLSNHNETRLQLMTQYEDYLQQAHNKTYILELPDSKFEENNFLLLVFSVYSGRTDFQISYDPSFSKTKQVLENYGSTKIYEMDFNDIQGSKFNGTIYIRASGEASTYSITPQYKRKDEQDSLSRDKTRYMSIEGDYRAILFRDVLAFNDTVSYFVYFKSLGVSENSLKAYVCTKNESDGKMMCSISSKRDVEDSSKFKLLPLSFKSSIAQMTISKDECQSFRKNAEYSLCQIMFIAQPISGQNPRFSISVKLSKHTIRVSEGLTYYGILYQEQYNLYAFYPPRNVNDVTRYVIFLNKFTGSPVILSSLDNQEPTMQKYLEGGTDIELHATSMQYPKQSKGPIFIGIYSKDYSEYGLTVTVHRKAQKNQQNNPTDIHLQDGITLQFDLPVNVEQSNFIYFPSSDGKLELRIIELLGKVDVIITKINEFQRKLVDCSNKMSCKISVQLGEEVKINVVGAKQQEQQFTILVVQQDNCYQFPIGTPLYALMDPNETDCLQVRLNKKSPVQISTSFTPLQMLERPINLQVQVISTKFQTNTSPIFTLTQSTMIVDPSELIQDSDCSEGDCYLNVTTYNATSRVNFQLTVQYLDGIINLYDGISQHIALNQIRNPYHYFKYHLVVTNSIEIYLATQMNSKHQIMAKLVSRSDFDHSNSTDLFPEKGQTGNLVWTATTRTNSKALTLISIPKADLIKAITDNKLTAAYFLISVLFEENSENQNDFTIEVTQNQRTIYDGQTLTGFLQPSEATRYQLYMVYDSFLEVRPLASNPEDGGSCLTVRDENGKQLPLQQRFVNIQKKISYVILQAKKDHECPYQISLQQYETSFLQISESFTHSLKLEFKEKTHFIYLHNRDVSFKILEFLESGSSNIYVTPLTEENLQSGIANFIDSLESDDYEYKGEQSKYLEINRSEENIKYCYKCFYLITIEGNPAVSEEIMVLPADSSPILKENLVVDDQLAENQEQKFIFYADSDISFSLNIDVGYGSIEVIVVQYLSNPNGKEIERQTIDQGSEIISIKGKSKKKQNGMDMFNPLCEYAISIRGNTQSSYHLQINKQGARLHLVEGISSSFYIKNRKGVTLYFQSLNSRDQIHILLDFQQNFPHFYSVIEITPSEQKQVFPVIRNSGQLERITIQPKEALYFINIFYDSVNSIQIKDVTDIKITATIPRHDLTELVPHGPIIATHQAIFEIYIPTNTSAVIELYDCSETVFVRGSEKYDELVSGKESEGQIQLLHENIAGHYIIHTKHVTGIGRYFLRAQSKQYSADINEKVDANIEYLISYYILPQGIPCPYMVIDAADNQVYAQIKKDRTNITFSFDPLVSIQQNSLKIQKIDYQLAIAYSQSSIISKYMCFDSEAKILFSKKAIFTEIPKKIELNVTKSDVFNLIGSQPAYVGVIGTLHATSGNITFNDIVYIYQPTFIQSFDKHTLIEIGFDIFGWLTIISLICGGGVFAYAIIVNLMKMSRGYQQDMAELNEEGSTTGVPNPGHKEDVRNEDGHEESLGEEIKM